MMRFRSSTHDRAPTQGFIPNLEVHWPMFRYLLALDPAVKLPNAMPDEFEHDLSMHMSVKSPLLAS